MAKGAVAVSGIGIVLIAVIAGCAGQIGGQSQGRAVFTVSDTAVDIESVSSIKMTVESVRVRNAAQEWITISSSAKTFDLLQLKAQGNQALLADASLEAGSYDRMQLDISSVTITDARGESSARMPSSQFTVAGDLIINANSTSTAAFDFIADESLHLTGGGEYVFAPVVDVETKQNAVVDVQSSNNVFITSGDTVMTIKVGMDVNGDVGVGLGVPADANLSLGVTGTVIIGV